MLRFVPVLGDVAELAPEEAQRVTISGVRPDDGTEHDRVVACLDNTLDIALEVRERLRYDGHPVPVVREVETGEVVLAAAGEPLGDRSWRAERMLTTNRPADDDGGSVVRAPGSRQTSSIGGSSETEVRELTVMPCGAPSCWW